MVWAGDAQSLIKVVPKANRGDKHINTDFSRTLLEVLQRRRFLPQDYLSRLSVCPSTWIFSYGIAHSLHLD